MPFPKEFSATLSSESCYSGCFRSVANEATMYGTPAAVTHCPILPLMHPQVDTVLKISPLKEC